MFAYYRKAAKMLLLGKIIKLIRLKCTRKLKFSSQFIDIGKFSINLITVVMAC